VKELAIMLRILQLYAHQAHQIVGKAVFMPDHDLLADIYTAAEKDYDDVIERIIGLTGEQNIPSMQEIAQNVAKLPGVEKENSAYFEKILQIEMGICSHIESLAKSGISQGTLQLVGDICNRLEKEQYKIKRRLKK
jgi:DNA-binding ferritin-like protein